MHDLRLRVNQYPLREMMQLGRDVASTSIWLAMVLVLLLCAITYPW